MLPAFPVRRACSGCEQSRCIALFVSRVCFRSYFPLDELSPSHTIVPDKVCNPPHLIEPIRLIHAAYGQLQCNNDAAPTTAPTTG